LGARDNHRRLFIDPLLPLPGGKAPQSKRNQNSGLQKLKRD
jgi:hypothetical protein